MVCKVFKTDPKLVTPFGIWLAVNLNKVGDFIWPFVRQKTYNNITIELRKQIIAVNEAYQHLEEFEDYHFNNSKPSLAFPGGKMEYRFNETVNEYDMCTRFSFKLTPMQGNQIIDQFRMRKYPERTSDYVKESLIRRTGELWQEKGETEARRYFEGIEDNDK
jgi:hypothetical protein